MAYVNMTVDGQTKRTSVLNIKDVNNQTKTATLEAVLEASDTQGGITPSGNKMITTAQQEDVTQYATAQVSLPSDFAEILKEGETVLGITGRFAGASGSGFETVIDMDFVVETTFDSTTNAPAWITINIDKDLGEELEMGSTSNHSDAKEYLSVIELKDKTLATNDYDFIKAIIPFAIVKISTGSNPYQTINGTGGGIGYQNVSGNVVAMNANSGYGPHIFSTKPTLIQLANRASATIAKRTVAGTYNLKIIELS